jgi:hypothetical protein
MNLYKILTCFVVVGLLGCAQRGVSVSTDKQPLRVIGIGEELSINPIADSNSPTKIYIPKSPEDAYLQFNSMLPTNLPNMIKDAYISASGKGHPADRDTWILMHEELVQDLSKYSKDPESVLLNFRNSLVTIWDLNGVNDLTKTFRRCGLVDAQSIATILIETYGVNLSGGSVNIDLWCQIEINELNGWNQRKGE